jgi:histidine triad (HIT) family protein
MTTCIFCKIITGDIPCLKIYEDQNYLAFLDISQFTPGHTLVVPKTHYRFVWDHPHIGEYYQVIQKIADHYRKVGYEFVDSLVLGRMIPHAHVHLIPHNDEVSDYRKIISGFDSLINDPSRHPSSEVGSQLVAKLKL